MSQFFSRLFSSDFMPHGMCYLWNGPVLWLNVISDGAIGISYYSIPLLLLWFVRRRKDLAFRWIFVAFAVFIIACGTTHIMGIWTVWHGTYRLDGLIKAITAVSSVVTAALLVPLLPALIALPGPGALARLNRELEQRVAERTAELQQAADSLVEEVAQRKRIATALTQSEEQYRLLFEGNPQPMWVYDIDTLRFLTANSAAVATYGYSREEFLAMTIKDIRPAEQVPALLESVARNSRGIEYSAEWLHRKRDGTIVNVEITSHPIFFAGRQARLVMVNDVTERKRLEEQFRHAQKMEAVGLLAGGVAHDFNNLLTVISGYGQMLFEAMEPHNKLRRFAEYINDATDRAALLTRQLLAFSRQQVMVPKVLDLNVVVAEANSILQRLIGENIRITIIPGQALGRVKADQGQIDQVILNLGVNARDAMPEGGQLIIETGNIDLDETYTHVHANVRPGPYVMLAITDTGTGMDEKTRAHVFEPFFTTKGIGKGTGLGLSTVYGIVKQSGGYIWLYSEVGRGTTFKIYLPRVAESGATDSVSIPALQKSDVRGGAETILLVEDDELVRAFVLGILRDRGYRVLEASNGVEAIAIAGKADEPIHLILTDVVMPELGGRDAAAALVAQRAGLKVLYMSGYTNDVAVLQELLDAKVPYIQKPFSPEVLARTVRSILDAGAFDVGTTGRAGA